MQQINQYHNNFLCPPSTSKLETGKNEQNKEGRRAGGRAK
jgi:hypothetical protein